MSLPHGGHLTHGSPVNMSGKWFNVVAYGLHPETELIDYDAAERLAHEHRPKLIIAGASAYSRVIDWKRFRAIADAVGAQLMVDMAHYAGLVAAGIYPSPVGVAQFVTSTTHKTLRGPRGGLILTDAEREKAVNSAVFPGLQGGPLMHVIAAKAVAFQEALHKDFRRYQAQVVENARVLAKVMQERGLRIVSGGTDSHLFLVDLRAKTITGKDAEAALGRAGITVNKNAIPFDTYPIFRPGGIRVGTPAVTTRGMKEEEMLEIADLLVEALSRRDDPSALDSVRAKVRELTRRFPLPS
jgi:glycine hydroxymethyltransferase